jgi:hypothetical protein
MCGDPLTPTRREERQVRSEMDVIDASRLFDRKIRREFVEPATVMYSEQFGSAVGSPKSWTTRG